MTLREVFDTVKAHLLAQGERCESSEDGCMYRGWNGMKCAAGVLIKDEFYKPSLERRLANFVAVREALESSGVPAEAFTTPSLIDALQRCHDHHPVSRWAERLDEIERDYFPSDAQPEKKIVVLLGEDFGILKTEEQRELLSKAIRRGQEAVESRKAGDSDYALDPDGNVYARLDMEYLREVLRVCADKLEWTQAKIPEVAKGGKTTVFPYPAHLVGGQE